MEVGEATLKSGTNYLSQALRERSQACTLLALPSECGAAIVRRTQTGIAVEACVEAHTKEGKAAAPILAVAWSPPAAELLALAYADNQDVQVWRLSSAGNGSTLALAVPLPGVCRQLSWHPYRRLLAAAVPDRVLLIDLGAGAAAAPTVHELHLPDYAAGALAACAWSRGGAVLAAACQHEVVLYHWAIAGAGWDLYSFVRYPVPHRLLRVLHPVEVWDGDAADDDEDERLVHGLTNAFVLGLGIPIAAWEGAEMTAVGEPRLLNVGESSTIMAADAAATAAPEVLDLRGRLGGDLSAAPRSLLDLSDELEALRPRPPASLRHTMEQGPANGSGAILICSADASGMRQLCEAPLELQQPDMLASTPIGTTEAQGRLAACSSSSSQVFVFACCFDAATSKVGLEPLWAVALIDGYRARGLAFNAQGSLFALGGHRQHKSVVFSSTTARQQLLLCTFDDSAQTRGRSNPVAPNDVPSETIVPSQLLPQPAGPPAETAAGAPAAGDLLAALLSLREHINSRFDRLERVLDGFDVRLTCMEHGHAPATLPNDGEVTCEVRRAPGLA